MDALRPTLAVPVIMVLIGAVSCLAIRSSPTGASVAQPYVATPGPSKVPAPQ
jgi:hypothetical protein